MIVKKKMNARPQRGKLVGYVTDNYFVSYRCPWFVDECSWRKAEVKGDIPAPRSGATLSAVGKCLFLFGGLSRNSGWFNDIYVFDTGALLARNYILYIILYIYICCIG